MNALEEWTDDSTEKLIGTKNLVLSWKDVANLVGCDNPEGIIKNVFIKILFVNNNNNKFELNFK